MLPTLPTPTLNRLPAADLAPMLMLCTAASATSAAHLVPVPNYDAALQRQIAEMSSRVQATVVQLVMALASVPRYRYYAW